MSGGTLALEAVLALRSLVDDLASNLALPEVKQIDDAVASSGHVVVDLGADELTRGRPHPMIDQTLLLEMLAVALDDPSVATVLLDVVLGDGAHPDPAAALAERIAARPPGVEVVVILVGTELDPQGVESQVERLEAAGARVHREGRSALARVAGRLLAAPPPRATSLPTSPRALEPPGAVINVGAELFHRALLDQGVKSVQVQWRPPAGGDARLMAILERMRR
jgi:FdrA protein